MGLRSGALITERSFAGGFTNEGGVGGTIRLLRNIPGLWLVRSAGASGSGKEEPTAGRS